MSQHGFLLKIIKVFFISCLFFIGKESIASQKMINNGVYVGFNIGYDLPIYHENTLIENDIFQTNQVRDHAGHGGVGGIFMGYRTYLNNFYLGGELFGNLHYNKDTSYANQTQGGVNITNRSEREIIQSYGISFIPGIKINEGVLLYARLGYARGEFTSHLTRSTSITGSLSPVESHTSLNGIDYGIGTEINLTKRLSLRSEFKHTDYFGKVVVNTGANFSPKDNIFSVGIVYKL